MKLIPSLIAAILVLAACSTAPTQSGTGETAAKARQAKAQAMFNEHCKTAGEKITRTVDYVEGIYLLKLRPKGINYGSTPEEQFLMDDPYGRDFDGDAYIRSFLRGFFEANYRRPDVPLPNAPAHIGYRYVEALDPADGKRYRYTGRIDEPWRYDNSYSKAYKRFVLDKLPAPADPPRYGVTYDDLSTREDREYWIAGSSLKVIDLKTNEVIAERIGYMWDPGQGNNGGGRSPWLMAADHACPAFAPRHGSTVQLLQSENFVEKVLHPIQEK
ncbi:MAG TPA: hypothetical protein VFW68_01760 [Rhodocyclaceae bacterium]|nr:hypothetical protein [Rhodocyclaceae bacterium]